MKISLRYLGLIFGLVMSLNVFADAVKDEITVELGFIKRVFETGYAPAAWKKSQFNWDINTEYDKAMAALSSKADITAAEYRQIVRNFLASTHDYHVGFNFYATEAAKLPFQTYGVNGHYYVVWVDKSKLSNQTYPIQPGDEIVTWNGAAIEDVMRDLRAQVSWSVATTDSRLADLTLTNRRAARAITVPQGRVDITFKRTDASGKSQMLSRQFTWEYTPETIDWNPGTDSLRPFAQKSLVNTQLLNPQMSWGMWEAFAADGDNVFNVGGRTSYVPTLGQVIWRSDEKDHFDAYIYRNEAGKLIGYVRIPHYMEDATAFVEFRKVIQKMQGATDGLVIDEINNPGGSIFYVLALMSVLSDQPIKVPDHHITLWPAQVDEILKLKAQMGEVKNDDDAKKAFGTDTISGFPVNYQLAQSVLEFTRNVETAWKNKQHLTEPLHLFGVDKVNPDPEVNYTKPIVVLVNELDFSGGDFFPAILQDNKRVKIFGQRTSGAGGYILSVNYPSALGLQQFSFTGSLARRVNNDPIENLGVTPDIPYTMTDRDFLQGFVDYKNAINKAIQDQL